MADAESSGPSVRSKIEVERRRLQRACAVLSCLMVAADEESDDVDLGDVAHVVRDLVLATLAGLDAAKLVVRITD